MDLEKYHVKSYDENTSFEFFSEGPNGRIRKIVQYQKITDGLFNLAFGDWDYTLEKLIDTTRSNNSDTNKVLATVAETASSFLNAYPEVVIHIQGSTPARNRLYQMNINKYWKEINREFTVAADYNGAWEFFQPGKNYKAFAVGKKIRKLEF